MANKGEQERAEGPGSGVMLSPHTIADGFYLVIFSVKIV